jgi:hypothetical protein
MKSVSYYVEKPAPLTEYVLRFMFSTLGVSAKQVTYGMHCDIYYGNNPWERCEVIIQRNQHDTLWDELVRKGMEGLIESHIDFDIVNAVGSFLTDAVNMEKEYAAYDQHERLKFETSFQKKNGIEKIPVVNLYVRLFEKVLEETLGRHTLPLWPNGKKYAIALSHDVDFPDKYAFAKNLGFLNQKSIMQILKDFKTFLNENRKRITDKNRENYWLFEDIIEHEERFGFKSTFFFASVNMYDKWGTRFDVAYNIRWRKFRNIINTLRNHGFEIGLHASYNAFMDAYRFRYEKERLERVAQSEIRGLRHHYWHMGKNVAETCKKHEEAGFCYDTSVAFNELGFRRSVALPYHPWHAGLERSINVLQLPTFCMDTGIIESPERWRNGVKELIKVTKTIKLLGGMGAVDWHVRTSLPERNEFSYLGKIYIKFLKYLSHDKDAWVTTLCEVERWIKSRSTDKPT